MTSTSTSHPAHGMVDPEIFLQLQSKIDEDTAIRERIRDILQDLEKHGRKSQSSLARAHSTPSSQWHTIIMDTKMTLILHEQVVQELAAFASKYSYYKYSQMWTRNIQDTCFYILLCGWLGGLNPEREEGAFQGELLTIEEVGEFLDIPVNLKDEDSFHLTIEEYLHALISLIDELTRLAVNSVTQGDYDVAVQISKFIKDVHAGFQILNLKNDSLRKRSDSIKYSVKKVEDVVYDLSLRNLIPSKGA